MLVSLSVNTKSFRCLKIQNYYCNAKLLPPALDQHSTRRRGVSILELFSVRLRTHSALLEVRPQQPASRGDVARVATGEANVVGLIVGASKELRT